MTIGTTEEEPLKKLVGEKSLEEGFADRLIAISANLTAEEFDKRIRTGLILVAYLEKRFAERYPEEFAKWDIMMNSDEEDPLQALNPLGEDQEPK